MNAAVLQELPAGTDRQRFLGASDIAAVLGISPWSTPVQLYHKKTAPKPPANTGNKREKRRGQRWEAVVGEMLVEELQEAGHDVKVVRTNTRYRDSEFDFMASEIDWEIRLDGLPEIINVELKTVHPNKAREWGQEGTDQCPVFYTAQAMQGLGITGRRACIVAALFGADEIKTYQIGRDEETIAAMRQHGARFWNDHVLKRVPPEPTTIADLKLLFPHELDVGVLEADPDLTEKVLRLRTLDRQMKATESEWELIEFQIMRAMGERAELHVHGKPAITWKHKPYQYIDQDAMKERYPKVLKEVLRKETSRVFSLRQFAWCR